LKVALTTKRTNEAQNDISIYRSYWFGIWIFLLDFESTGTVGSHSEREGHGKI